MKLFSPARTLAPLSLFVVALTSAANGQYTNGQNASSVLGQSSFDLGAAPNPPTQSSLSTPQGVVSDPVSGKLFVVDTGNNRILRYSSAFAVASGSAAEAVLGQANFTTGPVVPPAPTPPVSASNLKGPSGAAVDSAGNLWVADTGNHRVLRYANAATTISGTAAVEVLGQATFTTNTPGTTQLTMRFPSGVAVASNGALFVADRDNNRVLRFNSAASKTDGAVADGVLGQGNFLSQAPGTTSSTLRTPYNLAIDSLNNIWVADLANNRVVRFSNAISAADGASASAVVGQPDFLTSAFGTTSSSFSAPIAVNFDTIGRLYVADFSNNRVLIFKNPQSITTNGTASIVLGQTDFVSNGAALTASGLFAPYALSYNNGSLFVADSNSTHNRVLTYAITAGTPVITTSPTKVKLKNAKTKSYSFIVSNNSSASDVFVLRSSVGTSSKKKVSSLTFSYAGQDITSSLQAGTFKTPEFGLNQPVQIVARVTVRNPSKAKGRFVVSLTATSTTFSSVTTTLTSQATIEQP